jgi:hypothetical protein
MHAKKNIFFFVRKALFFRKKNNQEKILDEKYKTWRNQEAPHLKLTLTNSFDS